MIDILLTAEEFMDRRFEYQDEGRWSELHGGQVVHLPADRDHEHLTARDAGDPCKPKAKKGLLMKNRWRHLARRLPRPDRFEC